jgi:D-tyrosyl-tRNA(Tyr) deacylase
MRFVIQRVKHASVTVDNEIVGKIGPGLMILVGLTEGDTDEFIDHVTDKFLNLRLWDDSKGTRWKECVKSLNYEILLVSQFTLYSYMKGNKPEKFRVPAWELFNLVKAEKKNTIHCEVGKIESKILGTQYYIKMDAGKYTCIAMGDN